MENGFCRELQDLKQGAVRTAVLSEGLGGSVTEGDVVVLRAHCSPGIVESDQMTRMANTLDKDGGTLLVAALGKGHRLPRGWELVIAGELYKAPRVCTPLDDSPSTSNVHMYSVNSSTGSQHKSCGHAARTGGAQEVPVVKFIHTVSSLRAVHLVPMSRNDAQTIHAIGPTLAW